MDKKYCYQPDVATSVICWSFTFMIFLLSMLLWLEITVLQPWTIVTFIIFIVVFALQVGSRQIKLGPDRLLLNKVIKTNNEGISYADISAVATAGHKLLVKTRHNEYELLMKKSSVQEVAQLLRNKIAVM